MKQRIADWLLRFANWLWPVECPVEHKMVYSMENVCWDHAGRAVPLKRSTRSRWVCPECQGIERLEGQFYTSLIGTIPELPAIPKPLTTYRVAPVASMTAAARGAPPLHFHRKRDLIAPNSEDLRRDAWLLERSARPVDPEATQPRVKAAC